MRLIWLTVFVVTTAACHKADPISSDPKPGPSATALPVEPTPTPPPPSDAELILKKTSLADAIAFSKPMMDEKFGEISHGTAILTVWSIKTMTWPDVGVAANETSFAKVVKDSDEERGKRLCVKGLIIQISVVKHEQGKHYTGLLSDAAAHLFHFSAVGNTDDVVERKRARFCGIVTGRYDYSNSGGGTSHAVDLVGMFDLPGNKTAK